MRKIRTLIVDDDPMVADINRRYTESVEGFSVVSVAKNGKTALEVLEKTSVDLIILDVYLPLIDGVEVLSTLRKQEREIDVIIITAADDSKVISKVLRHGVIAYITKPFKFDRYRSVLEAYRCFCEKTLKQQQLKQKDIDGLMLALQTATPEDIPKNLNTQTMGIIINYLLQQSEYLSAEAVASGVGISRGTARRYLEYLVTQKQAVKAMDYLSVGRPVNRFKIMLDITSTKQNGITRKCDGKRPGKFSGSVNNP